MKPHLEIRIDNTVNGNFNLSVYFNEKREGFFVIHLVGQINTITFPILQNVAELIFKSKPEIIIFDMQQVNYINFRGLRVILRTIIEMNQRCGKVYLTDLQPEIKEMFEIMNGALPDWVFGNRKQLENYLEAIHSIRSNNRYKTEPDAETRKYNRRVKSNSYQGVEQSNRV